MKMIDADKDKMKVVFETDMNISLANALRRSVNEIPILAIDEIDIYKNDSALYDEIVAHRFGLVPLKNQKLKKDGKIEFKLKVKGNTDGKNVLSGDLGDDVVYPEMPIVYLENGQELEVVARAVVGLGKEHAKHVPGLVYYRNFPEIKITAEGEKQKELAELYPHIFEFDGKLKVKDAWKCDLDNEDLKDFDGVSVSYSGNLIFVIESWGMIEAKEIFTESAKALKSNLSELTKALK